MPSYCPLGDEIEAAPGTSICEALLENGIAIEHACEMSCACTTCHVIVREGFDSLGEMDEIRGRPARPRLGPDADLAPVLPGDPVAAGRDDRDAEVLDQPRAREPLSCAMKVLGIESSCDETGVALVDASRRGRAAIAGAGAAQPGRHAPGLRRRGARTGLARPHPPRAAADAPGAGRGRLQRCRTSTWWPTPAARAWPARCWSVPAWPWPWPRRWTGRRWACTTSKATCCRRSCRPTRRSSRSSRCWSPAATRS